MNSKNRIRSDLSRNVQNGQPIEYYNFIKIMRKTLIHDDLGFRFPSDITIINGLFAFTTRFLLFIGGCVSSLPQLAWN